MVDWGVAVIFFTRVLNGSDLLFNVKSRPLQTSRTQSGFEPGTSWIVTSVVTTRQVGVKFQSLGIIKTLSYYKIKIQDAWNIKKIYYGWKYQRITQVSFEK